MISEERKSEYWNHFTDERHRVFRPKKITDLRLRFIKKMFWTTNSTGLKLSRKSLRSINLPTNWKQYRPPNIAPPAQIFGQ